MTTKKITFDIESREDEEDRTTISIDGIGEVVLIETFPEYEFLEDIGEDGLEELNVEEGDLIGKIEHLEIEDEYKGQGYAKILMNKAIELAKEKGLMPLYLNASPMGSKRYGLDVDDLTGFYESLGFEVFLRQGGNNLMILKDTYKIGGETKNKIMAKQIKIQFEDNYAKGGVTYSEWSKCNIWQGQFNDWMEDGNVIKNSDGTYSTQDAQYTNSLKGINGLKKYFYNEFIKGQYAEGGITDNNHLIAKAIEFVTGYAVDTDTIQEKENNYSFRYKGRNVYSSLNSKLVNDTIRMHRKSLEGRYAKGGSVGKGYNVFNYTDNIYATDEVFKTEKLANDFIKEFRNRFSKQGYYRDNQMNKIAIEDIDLLAIPSDFNPFGKYEDGGEMQEEKFRYKDFYQSQGGIKFKTEEEAERFIKTTKPFVRKQLREGNLVLVFNGKEYFIAEKIKINDEYADGGEIIVDGLTKQDFIDAFNKRVESVIENLKQKGQYDSEDFDLLGEVDKEGGFTEIEDVGYWLHWAEINGNYDALIEIIWFADYHEHNRYQLDTLAHFFFGKPMKIDLYINTDDSEYAYNTELQKIKLLLNKIDFDKIQGEINYEEIENNTNLKFYKDGTLVMSLNGDWNEESEELDTTIDIDGETTELNYHPLDSMGGVNMEQLEKNINEALRELNTYSAVVSIEGYEEYAEDVEGLENAKALMQDIKGNTRFQVLKGSSVGIGKRVDDSRVVEEFAKGGETKTPKKYIVKGNVYDGGEVWKETFDNIDEAIDLAREIQNGWTDDGTYYLITIYDEKGKKVATISDDKYFNELTEHKFFKKVLLGADTKKERQVENEKLKGYKFNLQVRIADGGATGIFDKTFDSIFDVMDKMNTYYEEDYYAHINDEGLDYWEDKYSEIDLSRNYIKGKYGWSFVKENNYWIAKDDYDNNHIVRIVNGKPTSDSSITKGALNQILELESQKKYSEKPKHNKSLSDMKKIWDKLSNNYNEREDIAFLIGYYGGLLSDIVPYKWNDLDKSIQIQIMNAYFGKTEEEKQKIINETRKQHEALVKKHKTLRNLYGKKYADGGETMYRKFYAVSFWLKDGIDAQNWIKENGLTNYELEIEEGDEEINGNGYRVNVYNLGAGKYNTLTYLDSIVDTMIEEDKYASGGEIDTTDLITNMKNGLVVKFSFDYAFGEKGTEYLFFKNDKFYYLKIMYKNGKNIDEDKEIVSEQDVIDFYSLHYDSISGEFYNNKMATGGEVEFDNEGTSMVLYHEKKGNWLVPKGQVYLYLYDVEDSGSKLGKEFDWVFYPLTAPIMAFQSGYIPPLKKIWTKKFQKDHKGSEHLLGVIKAYLIEEDGKKELFIDMMSVNPTKKKKGIMSYMIKELRESFNLSQDQVTFSDLTDEGKKFVEKKTYADGGETSGLITDEQVKDLSFKIKIKNVPLKKGVLLHEIVTLEEFDLPDEENINFYPFHLIYGDSSLAIFDAFGVDEVAGLKRKDCEEFINNLKAQGKTEKDGSFIAGLTNYVGDKLFMFFNVGRLSYEGFANRVLPHEALHLSRSLISLLKNDWVRENLNTPKWWEDKRAVFVDMGDSNEEFFAETLERTTAIAMDGWYRVTGQKCVVEKNKTYADGGEITIRHEIKNGKKNYFLYDIKTGKKSGSYKSQTEANDKLKNLLQMKYALKLSSRKYADGGSADDDIHFFVVIDADDKNYNKVGYSLGETITDKEGNEFEKLYFENQKLPKKYSVNDISYLNDRGEFSKKNKITGTTNFVILVDYQEKEPYFYIYNLTEKFVAIEGYNWSSIIKSAGIENSIYAHQIFADGGDVPHEDKMFQLPLEMVVYVPSTQDVDKVISVDKMVTRVDEVKEYLASKFGGYTSADKLGGFVDSTGNLVNEDVVQVTAFATKEAYEQYKEELIHQLALWGKKWGQEAIGFEFEGDLMYVPQEL